MPSKIPMMCLLAGALLGVLLFFTFFVTGHGLGSSGGVNRVLVALEDLVVPRHVDTTPYLAAMAGGNEPTPDGRFVHNLPPEERAREGLPGRVKPGPTAR